MTNEQNLVSHAPLIANYLGIAVSFITILWLMRRHNSLSFKAKFLAGYVAYYAIAVIGILTVDRYITYRVNSFDRDGDKVFQSYELVGDLGFFWELMIRDTGRNVAPITHLFLAFIGAGIAYLLAYACNRFTRCRHT